jgi:hypothetical protein
MPEGRNEGGLHGPRTLAPVLIAGGTAYQILFNLTQFLASFTRATPKFWQFWRG